MSRAGKVFLVLLRIVIGWHFLYEGVWKIASDHGGAGQQYTSRQFLEASTARLRDSLRSAGTNEATTQRIAQWEDEVVRYFKAQGNELSEEQKARLGSVSERLTELATRGDAGGFDWIYLHEDVLRLAGEKDGRTYFTSEDYLRASTGPLRGAFRSLIYDAAGLGRLTAQSAQARIDERYDRIVRHFEARGFPLTFAQRTKLSAMRDRLKASIAAQLGEPGFKVRLADYRALLGRVRSDAGRVTAPFSGERLTADRKRLDTTAAELLAFVNEPVIELGNEAQRLETVEQMKAGPPPHPSAPTRAVDMAVSWGLTAIGACLMLGLFTPFAAAAAALQLAVFYLASPPWPGLPASTMGGHFLYVDRNLIEMTAALALVFIPTGRWAGFDFWLIPRRTHVVERTAAASR